MRVYRKILIRYRIFNDPNGVNRVWNFDEGGIRVGVMRGKKVYVPAAIKEFYEFSPEDRRQVTIIEGICVDGSRILGMCIVAVSLY